MIEQGLFFAAGACASALLWVLFLPALWRRAMRLSRARLAFSLPLSLEEVLAEQDRLRAAHAVSLAQAEQVSARHLLAASEAKKLASASRQERLALELRCTDYKAMVDRLELENTQLSQVVAEQREGIAQLVAMLATLHVPPHVPHQSDHGTNHDGLHMPDCAPLFIKGSSVTPPQDFFLDHNSNNDIDKDDIGNVSRPIKSKVQLL